MGKKGGGHHGGAWKVAYADFVTALMALFMVLWIVAQDDEIVLETSKFFKNPFGIGFNSSQGTLTEGSTSGDRFTLRKPKEPKSSLMELKMLHQLASEYYKALNMETRESEIPVKVDVVPDGVRITIFDEAKKPIFIKGTARLTEWGNYMMQNLAWLLDRNDFKIRIDSHLPKNYEASNPQYGPWELTVDRSNEARRVLEQFALKESRIFQVSGFASNRPLPGFAPELMANQRIEISLVVGEHDREE